MKLNLICVLSCTTKKLKRKLKFELLRFRRFSRRFFSDKFSSPGFAWLNLSPRFATVSFSRRASLRGRRKWRTWKRSTRNWRYYPQHLCTIFLSCNFMSCHLARHFHVLLFWRCVIFVLGLSVIFRQPVASDTSDQNQNKRSVSEQFLNINISVTVMVSVKKASVFAIAPSCMALLG